MAFFTENFLNNRREEFLRSVVKFQYQTNNSEWNDGTINSKEIVGTDIIAFVNAPSSGVADTITGVRVYDKNGKLAGEQSISLEREDGNPALLRFTFPIVEE
jgi:hypothetical protein